jgi:hypothetical protein
MNEVVGRYDISLWQLAQHNDLSPPAIAIFFLNTLADRRVIASHGSLEVSDENVCSDIQLRAEKYQPDDS